MDKRKKQKGDFDMDVIETKGLSKDYGHGRGIFDVTFEVHKGEVYGFLGPKAPGNLLRCAILWVSPGPKAETHI